MAYLSNKSWALYAAALGQQVNGRDIAVCVAGIRKNLTWGDIKPPRMQVQGARFDAVAHIRVGHQVIQLVQSTQLRELVGFWAIAIQTTACAKCI